MQFRNGATVGGSVFGRYGFSDILTCMMMLDVQVELYQRGRISLEEFAKLPYDRDILVQVILKRMEEERLMPLPAVLKRIFLSLPAAWQKKETAGMYL